MRAIPLLSLASLLAAGTATAQPYAFVTSGAENEVAVLNLASDTVIGSFPLDGLPSGAALNADGTQLYVVRSQADRLARVNTQTGSTVTIQVDRGPAGVWVDPFPFGGLVYVTSARDDCVTIVNPSFNVALGRILVGRSPLAITGYPGRVYVANWRDGTVSVVDTFTSGFPVIATIPVGRSPAGLLLNPVAGRLYVANFADDTVSVINTSSLAVTATIPVCTRPRGLAATGSRLFVSCFNDGMVNAIDTATNQVVLSGPSGAANPLDLQASPDGQRLYSVHFLARKGITVMEAATLTPLRAIDAPAGTLALAGFASQAPPLSTSRPRRGRAAQPVTPEARPAALPAGPPTASWSHSDDTMFFWDDFPLSGVQTTSTPFPPPGEPKARLTRHTGAGSADHALRTFGVYTPSQVGAILLLDASWDRKVVGEAGPAVERLVVSQDNRFYRTAPLLVANQTYQPISFRGLTAADFDDDMGGHPDFSPFGSQLRFGYSERYDGAGTSTYAAANFHVQLQVGPPPFPGELSYVGFADVFATLGEFVLVPYRRQAGALGAVGIAVDSGCDPFTANPNPIEWADGDAADKLVQIACFEEPVSLGGVVQSENVFLRNPTGGAVFGPTTMFNLWVNQPSPELQALIDLFKALASGFSPAWLLALGVPAGLMRYRARRHDRALAPPSARPATSPASEP